MKYLLALTLLIPFVACTKDAVKPLPEPTVSKNVRFEVVVNANNIADYFDDANAELFLGVEKVNKKTMAKSLIWDTTFSMRPLREYVNVSGKIIFDKSVPGITDSKEFVHAGYTVSY